VLTIASPLFWFNALRPLSDIPGLAAILAAQAALVSPTSGSGGNPSRTPEALEASGKMIVLGAFLSAVAIGFRSQAALLTLPLLALVLLQRAGRGAAGALLGSAMTFTIGVLVWAVPLIFVTGGVAAYRAALSSQGGEDFSGVDMLYRNPTPRRLALGLLQTFIYPWASTPLGWVVFILAGRRHAGLGMALPPCRHSRCGAVLPVSGISSAVSRNGDDEICAAPDAGGSVPGGEGVGKGSGNPFGKKEYGTFFWCAFGKRCRTPFSADLRGCARRLVAGTDAAGGARLRAGGEPRVRGIGELHRVLASEPGAVAMHQGFMRSMQTQDFGSVRILKAPPMREWLEVAAYWREGGKAPVWFLQDPARTDTELIDPLSGACTRTYVWSFPRQDFMSGVRPDIVDLLRIESPPGWFAEEGWHLTPETLNMSERLGQREAVAYVKSREEEAILIIGAESVEGAARISMTLDGRAIGDWTVPASGRLLRRLDLPAGSLKSEAAFNKLVVSYAASDGTPEKVRLTQFALEPAAAVFFVQHNGWNEIEYNRDLQRRWRWTTNRAETFINSSGRDVTLTMAGESPLKYFDAPPHVVVRAGQAVLATADPAGDFELVVKVPAAALAAADGMVTIETDKTFVPNERSGSPTNAASDSTLHASTCSNIVFADCAISTREARRHREFCF
jgi:hypothetical protein